MSDKRNPGPVYWGKEKRLVKYTPVQHPFYGWVIEADGHGVSLVVDRRGRLTRGWWECSCGSRGRETDPSSALYLAARHTGQQ